MDRTWNHLGARLSSRALRIVAGEPRGPGLLAGLADPELERLGLGAPERGHLRAAAAEARAAGGRGESPPCLCAAHPGYPERFWKLERPPAAVWVRGKWAGSPAARVAVVGARRATRTGRTFARSLGRELAGAGVEVWSGMARGVDGAAHEGALEAGGSTVAVLGAGVDVVYPPEHFDLARRIASRGALVSEFPPGTQPRPPFFPQRNRLLAAAADLVAVVEAGEKSGALTTVNWALALGTPLLVAPGDVLAESCRGSNRLLQAGAAPLLGAGDVLLALGLRGEPVASPLGAGLPGAHPLLEALRVEPLHVDELAEVWDGPGPVGAELVRLELAGWIESREGGYYALREAQSR